MNKNKGITLIALVITIIILLILAGITINQLTGENGLFARAKEATEKTKIETAREKLQLAIEDLKIQKISIEEGKFTLANLKEIKTEGIHFNRKQENNEEIDVKQEEKTNREYAISTVDGYKFKVYADNWEIVLFKENQAINENEYIKESLMLRYDGIQNTREGHKNNITTWEDLSGNGKDLKMYNTSSLSNTIFWEDDGFVQTVPSSMVLASDNIPELQSLEEETIEMVLYCAMDGTDVTRDAFITVLSNNSPYVGMEIQLKSGFSISGTVVDVVNRTPVEHTVNKYKAIYVALVAEKYNDGTGYKRLYINGEEYANIPREAEKIVIQDTVANYVSMFNHKEFATQLDNSFVGKIYSTRVYSKALSTEEIKHNYELDKTRFKLEQSVENDLGYVQNQLFMQYDGIVNTRQGHRSGNTWQDISGNKRDLEMYNGGLSNKFYWQKDGLIQTEASTIGLTSEVIPEIAQFTETTVETVFYPSASGTTNTRDIFSMILSTNKPYSGLGLTLHPSTSIIGVVNDQSSTTALSYTMTLNKPTYVAVVSEPYNSGTGYKRLYINGKEYTNTKRLADKFYIKDSDSMYINLFNFKPYATDTTNSFVGKIFSTRVYNRALSSEEILSNYSIDKTRFNISE